MISFKQKIADSITEMRLTDFSDRTLFKKLNMHSRFEKEEVARALKQLVNEGVLIEARSGQYTVASSAEVIKGTLKGNRKGFAFLIREDGKEDMFVPHRNLNGAQHGDTVYCRKVPKTQDEAAVVSVISRGFSRIAGTFKREGLSYGFVRAEDDSYFSDIFLPFGSGSELKDGHKVLVRITDYDQGKNPVGELIEILGKEGTVKGDITAIARSRGFDGEFTEKQRKEAERLSAQDISAQIGRREDFRALTTITIDGDDARDFDDAISLKKQESGYELYVHIADVSEYIKAGSILDTEALKRATSVYFPNAVLPMLPEAISNGCCSLNQKEDRLTLTAVISLTLDGKVKGSRVVESVINSDRRMTYADVAKILKGDGELTKKYADITALLKDMHDLAGKLSGFRSRRGSIDFVTHESKITLDGEKVINVERYPYEISNGIIEEFMLLANQTVAEFMFHTEFPFVYRVHEAPSNEKMEAFARFVQSFGYKFPFTAGVHGTQLQKLLSEIKDKPEESIISKIMLRSMQKAKYSTRNTGHFGLALDYYCHFTSPIRRYPDLMIHRVIKTMLSGKFSENTLERLTSACDAAAAISSEREREADLAERDADDYFKALYMKDKIGEVYQGYVSGVTAFGIFVELDNTVEGMVPLIKLPEDRYTFQEDRYTLKGIKHCYALGDRMTVKAVRADTAERRVEFEFYEG